MQAHLSPQTETVLRRAVTLLDGHRSLLTDASLARQLMEEKQKDGWRCALVDVSDARHEEEFARRWIDALIGAGVAQASVETLADLLDAFLVRMEQGTTAGNRQEVLDRLGALVDHGSDALVAITGLDAFTAALAGSPDGTAAATALLGWLERLRATEGTAVRWALCDAAGLRSFAETHGVRTTLAGLADPAQD